MMINEPLHASTICLAYGEPSISVSSYCCSHHSSRSCVSFMAPSPTNEWRYETSDAWRRPWPLVSAEKENASIRCTSERRWTTTGTRFHDSREVKKKKRARAPVAYTWLLLITLADFLLRVSLAPRKRCFNSGERLFCVTLVDPCLVPDGSIFYYPHLTNGGVGGNLPKVTGPSDFNDNFLLSEYGLLS